MGHILRTQHEAAIRPMSKRGCEIVIEGKTILITGGTGSFGRKFTEVLLQEHKPMAVRVFSRGELLQMQMQAEFSDESRIRYFIGDVRDRDRLYRAMNGVDIVVHAAALKQVPACEYNPIEAVRTNIDGAVNVIDAALDNGVEKVVALSTDKAVHPVNLYGATKLVAERLFVQANAYRGKRRTMFSVVRYGNVVASRGSVIPLFLKQRDAGTLTLTDARMTRFWITLEEGARLVLKCLQQMSGGEILVPKLPSMTLVDLATALAPGAQWNVTGIRPGEKLHEVLITEDEARHARECAEFFVIEPEHQFWDSAAWESGTPLPECFSYRSDNNPQKLSREQLRATLLGMGYTL
jgi:UDP-N-acetylglucosamine 4,6-dehydratase (inverting)